MLVVSNLITGHSFFVTPKPVRNTENSAMCICGQNWEMRRKQNVPAGAPAEVLPITNEEIKRKKMGSIIISEQVLLHNSTITLFP